VNIHVPDEMMTATKIFTTLGAAERSYTLMQSHVTYEVIAACECALTLHARVRLLPCNTVSSDLKQGLINIYLFYNIVDIPCNSYDIV